MYMSKVIDAVSLIRDAEQTSGMLAEVLAHVEDLRDFYPTFDSWISDRVLPGLHSGDRSILVEYRKGELAALAVLKDDGAEKKLCCLRVLPGFEDRHGLGVRLFEKSFDQLGTQTPLLSVAEERMHQYERIFNHFGFKKEGEYSGLYRESRKEYSFNGLLLAPHELREVRGVVQAR